MQNDELIAYLLNAGLIDDAHVRVTPLTGGVSSDIRLVETAERSFVVKRALEKLRVVDDWFADISRNNYEQAYLRYAGEIVPASVPAILFSDPAAGLFVMEYLDDGFANWKACLLNGEIDPGYAQEAGRILGRIHRASWDDERAAQVFDSTANFYELRLEPYLLTSAQRHPALADYLRAESQRIQETRLALVHGDFSPKNMLVGDGRLVLLDCEVAWYGEPAFDAAFLLNHFLLKSLHTSADPDPYLGLIARFWNRYVDELGASAENMEQRAANLLPMLLLARVDGKSPAEYITQPWKKDLVRQFAASIIPDAPATLMTLTAAWRQRLLENSAADGRG